jgi:predicted transposase/invertase (TIGR01784 family)
MQFLNPTNDVAFKKIFGSEAHKDVTISFINAVLNLTGSAVIKDVTFLNTEQKRIIADKKDNILDILCIDEENNRYIIEVQVAGMKEFDKRITFYAAKTYALQLDRAQTYQTLEPVITIAVLNFILFPDKKSYKSNHVILDRETYEHDLKDLSFAFIELPKFNKTENELNCDVDRWVYFLKNIYKESEIPKPLERAPFKEACEAANRLKWNVDELNSYHDAIVRLADDKGKIEFALAEGEAKGMIAGVESGKKEVAKKLLQSARFSIPEIALMTGLGVGVIELLARED